MALQICQQLEAAHTRTYLKDHRIAISGVTLLAVEFLRCGVTEDGSGVGIPEVIDASLHLVMQALVLARVAYVAAERRKVARSLAGHSGGKQVCDIAGES
jgi:hypothetical protein